MRITAWSWCLLTLLVSGCGGAKTGTISGQVTFKDKPLQEGIVSFVTRDGKVVTGKVHEGEYVVPNVPVGPARLTVRQIPESAFAKNQPNDIPLRYRSADDSGLRFEVVPGQQRHDLELEEK